MDTDFPLSIKYIASSQKNDLSLQHIFNYKANPTDKSTKLTQKEQRTAKLISLEIIEDTQILMQQGKLLIPKDIQPMILEWVHQVYMHPGESRFISILSTRVFWNNMSKDAKMFVKHCLLCKKNKLNTKQYGKLTATTIQKNISPFECIAIDIQGPLPTVTDKHGVEYQYILSIIDIKSRWVELIPLSDTLATTIASSVDSEWLCRYPRPSAVLSDQGVNLKAKEVQELFKSYGIRYNFTTTYMATANSICERVHQTINQILRVIDYDDWISKLPAIAFSLRAAVHRSLKTSPANVVFGLDMVLPLYNAKHLFNDKKDIPTEGTVQQDLKRQNKSRIDHNYNKGDLVFVRKSDNQKQSKWDGQNHGPYKVVEVHPNNTLTIDRLGLLERINLRRIIPW